MWLTDCLGTRGRRWGHHLPDRGQATDSHSRHVVGDRLAARPSDAAETGRSDSEGTVVEQFTTRSRNLLLTPFRKNFPE